MYSIEKYYDHYVIVKDGETICQCDTLDEAEKDLKELNSEKQNNLQENKIKLKRYNNYHKHDHISNIFSPDTNTKAEEYIKKCVEYGHTNYFTTNHGSMGDIFESKELCEKYGIRCLAGLEGYIVPNASIKDKSNYHIIIIPRTNIARRKLNKISSRANIDFYYYKPRIDLRDLLKLNKDDVYITSACCAGLLRDDTGYEQLFVPLYQHFGHNVFLEVQTHQSQDQIIINKKCLELKNKYGLRLIAANDSHYVDSSGKQERLELLKGKGITYGDEDTYILDFPDYDTFVQRFVDQGVLTKEEAVEAIDNTLIFDECEEIDIDKSIKMPTIYPELSPKERIDLLKKIVNKKFNQIKKEENIAGEELKQYKDGIRYEMKIIEDTNDVVHTADYFLLNTKIVDLAVNKYGGVLTRTGRGSCGSFYINRILGMTQIDRFKINLPLYPDRFMSTARLIENRAMPDIDFNVKSQEEFVSATRELLGDNMCFPMIAYGTMQLAEAFRNVCRSHDLEFSEFNEVAKSIEQYMNDVKWKPYIEEANKYVGTIVSASIHPCAHVVSNKDLTEEYGVVRLGDNICVMITSGEADAWKVLKNDYLIVTVWKLISETFDLIGKPIIKLNDLLKEIKDDKRIWNLFKNGITCTLNQVDSDNGTQQAKRYGVSSFEEGAFLAAAIRPAFNSWREDFLSRKEYDTGSIHLNEILKSTHGFILFQESLMSYFDWLGVTPAESIGLIKKISKKKIKQADFDALEDRLRINWIKQTGSEDGFKHTWDLMQSCMAYGFASPHAAATSGDMCYGAYLKVNYPLEYYTVALSNYANDTIRTNKLTKELEYFNIKLHPIKFRKSGADYTMDKESNSIYKGIASIPYLNETVPVELYSLKNEKFDTFIDLLIRLKDLSINSKQLDNLIKLDFFSEFGQPNTLLEQVKVFNAIYGKKTAKRKDDGFICVGDYSLPLEEFESAFSDNEEFKLSAKQAKGFDSVKLIKIICGELTYPQTTILDKIKYEGELLGYISVHDPQHNKAEYCVMDIKGKKKLTIVLYEIFSGKTREVKLWANSYARNRFDVGDIIYIQQLKKEHKKRPGDEVNPKTGKPIWVDIPDEFEYMLMSYYKVTEDGDGYAEFI